MYLATGRNIHSYSWNILLARGDVINRVHQLAIEERQPLIAKKIKHEWRIYDEIEDDENEEDVHNEVRELLRVNRMYAPILNNDNDDNEECESDDDNNGLSITTPREDG